MTGHFYYSHSGASLSAKGLSRSLTCAFVTSILINPCFFHNLSPIIEQVLASSSE